MFRKDFNIDEQERYYGRKFELISRIQDLRDLIEEIRAQEECAIKAGDMGMNINTYDEDYSDNKTGFCEYIAEALEIIQSKYIEKFETLKIEDF
nr:MAG TPA: hypothetical protein [Caudoviricetes sp.]